MCHFEERSTGKKVILDFASADGSYLGCAAAAVRWPCPIVAKISRTLTTAVLRDFGDL
jgi:hypothetical protein